MDFYFPLYNKSHMGEIYKTSCCFFYFQYQVLQNNKSVVILTKRSLKMSMMEKKKKKISLQDSGHPPTCEILHQVISRYVIEHTERKNRRFPSAAAPMCTEPTGNRQVISPATYPESQKQLFS